MNSMPPAARRSLPGYASVVIAFLTIADLARLREWQAANQPHLAI